MARKKLECRVIADLDPASAVMFNDYVKECVKDCQDRSGLIKARKVILTCTLVPDADSKGDMDGVLMNFKVRKSVPEIGGRTFSLTATKSGDLIFNDADPTSHHTQMTIDEVDPPESGESK